MTKGQKALEKIGSIVLDKTQDEDYGKITFRIKHLYSKSYEIIKKDLEVLEFLIKKRVDISEVALLIRYRKEEALKVYNAQRKVGYKLTSDEFESLKEVL